MKLVCKVSTLCVALVMVLSLAGCGSKKKAPVSAAGASAQQQAVKTAAKEVKAYAKEYPEVIFYEAWKNDVGKLGGSLANHPEIQPVINRGGHVTAICYTRKDKDTFRLFTGFSEGSVAQYTFKGPGFDNCIEAKLLIDVEARSKPAVTSLGYVGSLNKLYIGRGKKVFTSTHIDPIGLIKGGEVMSEDVRAMGAEILVYHLNENKFYTVKAQRNEDTTVDYLIPFSLSDNSKYLLAILGPKQLATTYKMTMHYTGVPMTPLALPVMSMSGGDAEPANQSYERMYVINADNQAFQLSDEIIRDEWYGGQRSYAPGDSAKALLHLGFADGTIRSYDATKNRWDVVQGLGWNTPVNVLFHGRSLTDSKKEYLMAGLENGTVQLYDYGSKKWNYLFGLEWNNTVIAGRMYNGAGGENYAVIGLLNGAIFFYNFDDPNGKYTQLRGPCNAQPMAISNVVWDDRPAITFYVAYDNGVVTEFVFDTDRRQMVQPHTDVRGEDPIKGSDDLTRRWADEQYPMPRNLSTYQFMDKLRLSADGKTLFASMPKYDAISFDTLGYIYHHVGGEGIWAYDTASKQWVALKAPAPVP